MSGMTTRERLPANLDAENAILGAILYDNSALDDLGCDLGSQHFHEPFHGRLFEALETTIRRQHLAEPILIAERFQDDPAFKALGGVRYLASMVDRAPPACNAPDYARAVYDLAVRRVLVKVGEAVAVAARDRADIPAMDQVRMAEKELAEITSHATSGSDWQSAGDVVALAVRDARERKGRIELTTGLSELDRLTGGFRRGEMAIVAARPSMGKSTALLALAKAFATKGRGVAFYSMEMPRIALGLRLACDLAFSPSAPSYNGRSTNPAYFDADRGALEPHQWQALEDSEAITAKWPVRFDCTPGQTVAQMEIKARRLFRDWQAQGVEPGAVMVDHLTIARADQDRNGNKVAEVGDISRSLAEMAKRLNVPVIAACQLSRDVEKRDTKDRRPGLSDLRWSGEIEQDARLVMFLYRPEYYVKRPENDQDMGAMMEWQDKLSKVRNKLFWLVEKNNNGPTGQVETFCNIACSAIRDRMGE